LRPQRLRAASEEPWELFDGDAIDPRRAAVLPHASPRGVQVGLVCHLFHQFVCAVLTWAFLPLARSFRLDAPRHRRRGFTVLLWRG
jgi:hypothetical protein